ncbi:MAG: cation:proton antiporter [Desulfuromonadales bacterium]|nr:cation:proton antiporter [Desulfuromonadales bacterium]
MLETASFWVILPILSLSLALSFIRMVLGPTLPDRIIALETIAVISVGMIVVYAIATGEGVLIDLASVWSVVSFLSIIAFAYYIERWRSKL